MCVREREIALDEKKKKKKKLRTPLVDYLQERINNCSMLLEIMDELC
jgi:hypothetical protein